MAKCVASKALMALELLRMLVVFASSKVDKSATRLGSVDSDNHVGQNPNRLGWTSRRLVGWLVDWLDEAFAATSGRLFLRIAARKKVNLKMNYNIISGK